MSMLARERFRLGVMFRADYELALLPDFACRAEAAGFDELWLAEDCFLASGIAAAATALARTQTITVGLGIMPAPVRNPVFTAMEIATLCGLYPGRFIPGLGHGVAGWMRQIGALPRSPLTAIEEVTTAIKRLLHGDLVTVQGQYIQLENARLALPPDRVPPVYLGVAGPKSLALAGRIADGVILPDCCGPAFIESAQGHLQAGQDAIGHSAADHNAAGRTGQYQLTVYSLCSVDPDPARARRRARSSLAALIAAGQIQRQLAPLGIASAIERIMANGGQAQLAAEMPDAWLEQLGIVGTPDECVRTIARLVDAGSTAVVLVPLPGQEHHELEVMARHIVSRLA